MSMAPLVDLADAVLTGLVAHWPPASDEMPYLRALPERQYCWVGVTPAHDREQVTVGIDRTFASQGDPSREAAAISLQTGAPWLRTMVVAIEIIRCIATVDSQANDPKLPAPDTIMGDTFAILTDGDATLEAIIAAQQAGELAGCGGIAMENWRAVNATGGLAGGITRLRLNLF